MASLVVPMVLALLAPIDPGAEAKRFLERCRDGEFEAAAGRFDATVGKQMPASKLEEVWTGVVGRFGPLGAMGEPRIDAPGKLKRATVRCEFEKKALDVQVAFDDAGKIAGFFFRPAAPAGKPEPAAYVDPSRFEETAATVGAEGWPLEGTLAKPKGVERAPLVVLIQGSGPSDRDESTGPNAPFRDLGQGLASRGVATLRYDKRTFVHGARMQEAKDASLESEVIADALAALAKARTLAGIDTERVYLLGHSMGASLAPEIARRDGKLAGIILLAASDRPPDEMILDQLRYVVGLGGEGSKEARAMLAEAEAVISRYRKGEAKDDESILGAPVRYWKSLAAIRPAKTAAELKDLPILVLQGGRDYQVIEEDFRAFRSALEGRSNAAFHLYPELNHLFMPGEGKPTPDEYERPGHVDRRVVEAIAGWIGGER